LAISAIAVAGLVASTYAQTNTTSPSTTATTTPSTAIDNATVPPPMGMGMMMGDQGFAGGPGDRFGDGFGEQMENIEISSAYNQTISNILGNDTDVQKLVSQGYNVTLIRPILSSTINADGTVTTKASTAVVTMQNGNSGLATISIDITNAKVTQIIIVTRTVIDKSTTSTTTS